MSNSGQKWVRPEEGLHLHTVFTNLCREVDSSTGLHCCTDGGFLRLRGFALTGFWKEICDRTWEKRSFGGLTNCGIPNK